MRLPYSGSLIAAALVAACAGQPPAPDKPPPGGPIWNAVLSQYGSWDEVDGLGVVWRPSIGVVGIGFVPYVSAGRWVSSEDGWSFQSDHKWGWATFHYGRWAYSSTYGWMWLPGSTWAPAWVDWRYGHGYVAWNPIAPSKAFGKERWTIVEARHFVERDLLPRAIPETPAITVALGRPAADASPFPTKEMVSNALGRPAPELSSAESDREELARKALRDPLALSSLRTGVPLKRERPKPPRESAPPPSATSSPPNAIAEATPAEAPRHALKKKKRH